MRELGYSENEACSIIHENNRWIDYEKAITRVHVHSLYVKGKEGRDAGVAIPAPLPSFSITNKAVLEDILDTVQWRLPISVVKPYIIYDYFVNNQNAYFVQCAPSKYFNTWHYELRTHSITYDIISKHMETAINPDARQFTIGIHEKNQDNLSKWICFDIDDKDNFENNNIDKTNCIIKYLHSRGIYPLLENASVGTESYHIWAFCTPTNANKLNEIGNAITKMLSINCEVFPKSNTGNIGNQVRLPYGLNRKRNTMSKIITWRL
jgi:hypothetical protein